MGRAKYYDIYIDLKNRIENKEYLYQDLLPSEYKLIEEYSCSRNTIRRAIQELAN
ncbi:GntR family transcriptional regulator, partial [Clostridioides difficile]